jgi:hypothetical protein
VSATSLFGRHDIGQTTVTSVSSGWLGGERTYTDFRLGGFQAGAAFRIGTIVTDQTSE